jgi:hypothetical protein
MTRTHRRVGPELRNGAEELDRAPPQRAHATTAAATAALAAIIAAAAAAAAAVSAVVGVAAAAAAGIRRERVAGRVPVGCTPPPPPPAGQHCPAIHGAAHPCHSHRYFSVPPIASASSLSSLLPRPSRHFFLVPSNRLRDEEVSLVLPRRGGPLSSSLLCSSLNFYISDPLFLRLLALDSATSGMAVAAEDDCMSAVRLCARASLSKGERVLRFTAAAEAFAHRMQQWGCRERREVIAGGGACDFGRNGCGGMHRA